MVAANPPWDAIGALAGVLSLLLTGFISWRGGTRSTVTSKVVCIEGKIEGNSVAASRIILKNRGFGIKHFKIRIDKNWNPLFYQVQECSTLDRKNARLSVCDEDLILEIDDLPPGEKIDIVVFGRSKVYDHQVHGGNSSFIIRTILDFYWLRFNWFFWGSFFSFMLFNLLRKMS